MLTLDEIDSKHIKKKTGYDTSTAAPSVKYKLGRRYNRGPGWKLPPVLTNAKRGSSGIHPRPRRNSFLSFCDRFSTGIIRMYEVGSKTFFFVTKTNTRETPGRCTERQRERRGEGQDPTPVSGPPTTPLSQGQTLFGLLLQYWILQVLSYSYIPMIR